MNGWKKCMVFLLALLVCLCLSACGEGDSDGESEDYYLKLGNKRRLQSGQTFQYTTSRGLDMSDSKICFEGDTTEYFWRER